MPWGRCVYLTSCLCTWIYINEHHSSPKSMDPLVSTFMLWTGMPHRCFSEVHSRLLSFMLSLHGIFVHLQATNQPLMYPANPSQVADSMRPSSEPPEGSVATSWWPAWEAHVQAMSKGLASYTSSASTSRMMRVRSSHANLGPGHHSHPCKSCTSMCLA